MPKVKSAPRSTKKSESICKAEPGCCILVYNSGGSGDTSDLDLKRLPKELERVSPDLLILIEGGNDILRNRSDPEIKENIKGMIELTIS